MSNKTRGPKGMTVLTAVAIATAGLVSLPISPEPPAHADTTDVTITPNPASRTDAFQGWGTSLIWFANATAGYSEELREDLYQKVFSEDGLNLNLARYNIGGGNASDVADYLHDGSAVEGWWNPITETTPETPVLSNLYNPDGSVDPSQANKLAFLEQWDPYDDASYNPNADQNQRWWVERLATDEQITHWEAFSNSPPWFMTHSGYVSGQDNRWKGENLLPEAEEKFAAYMARSVELLEEGTGISVDTIDPFNEPNSGYWGTAIDSATGKPPTSYTQKQEGALIYPAAQDRVLKHLAAELERDTRTTGGVISAMDETDPAKFMTNWNSYSPEAKAAIEQLNVHTYGTGDRRRVRDLAKSEQLPLWMSEVGGFWKGNPALGDSTSGWDRSNITNGLGIASRMVNDLRELEPDAWVFWQPVEDTYKQEKADKGWGSIYIDFDCNYEGREGYSNRRLNDGDSLEEAKCEVLTNQKYNTTRNFTHYIRPGDFLIQNNDPKTASALRADGTGATLVHFNDTASAETVTIDLSLFGTINDGATVTPVVTTKSPLDDIERNALVEGEPILIDRQAKSATLEVPAASVVTFLVDGVSGVADGAAAAEDGHTYHLPVEANGQYLAASGGDVVTQPKATTSDAVPAQQWTVHAVDPEDRFSHDQRWVISNGAGGVLAGAGGVLTGSSTGTASILDLDVEQAKTNPAAQWVVSTENGGQWTLVNAAAASSLHVSTDNGVTLAASSGTTSTARSNPNQVWAFEDVADLVLTGTEQAYASTEVGVAPELPDTVVPLYAVGAGEPAAVEWEAPEAGAWESPGEVVLRGSGTDIYGQTFSDATVVVTVGEYVATDPVSVTVEVGTPAAELEQLAPVSTPGQIGAGPARNPLPVTWDFTAVDDAALQTTGTLTIPGTAAVSGETLPATLTVLVVERLQFASICQEDAETTVTASYTEGNYGPENTCDGDTSSRWSNWVSGGRSGDSLSYAFSTEYTVDSVTVQPSEKAPRSLTVQYLDDDGVWQNTSAGTVTGLSTSAPSTVVLDPVTTRGIRVSLVTTGSYTKVSEVAISGSRLADAGIADLGRLLVGQVDVDGFDPAVTEYSAVIGPDDEPVVSAVPLDSTAAVEVTQATDDNPTAVVTVTAPDGSTKVYRITFTLDENAGEVILETKEQCKDGGWATSTEPVFRNQGDCVSYFAAGR